MQPWTNASPLHTAWVVAGVTEATGLEFVDWWNYAWWKRLGDKYNA